MELKNITLRMFLSILFVQHLSYCAASTQTFSELFRDGGQLNPKDFRISDEEPATSKGDLEEPIQAMTKLKGSLLKYPTSSLAREIIASLFTQETTSIAIYDLLYKDKILVGRLSLLYNKNLSEHIYIFNFCLEKNLCKAARDIVKCKLDTQIKEAAKEESLPVVYLFEDNDKSIQGKLLSKIRSKDGFSIFKRIKKTGKAPSTNPSSLYWYQRHKKLVVAGGCLFATAATAGIAYRLNLLPLLAH